MKRMSGVMLVEVLVALLVVSLALSAALSQVITHADATAELRDRSYAQWVAQNQLERLRITSALEGELFTGEMQGEVEMVSRTWYWNALSEPTQMEGMWRQTVEVGTQPDEVIYAAETYVKERRDSRPAAPPGAQ